jgi:predicted DNA-binding transcriptional regulator AlpA
MAQSDLDSERLIRLPDVLRLFPVSRAAWWSGVKTGRFPRGIKLGPNTRAWRLRDILALIETAEAGQ